jgi:sortase A
LLAVEVGAVLLFVAAGFTLWQTRSNLNDTYRNLQQTDPRALPTLIAAANPGAMVQAQAANDFLAERPALPTPYPTVTPVAAAIVEATVEEDVGAAREASADQAKADSSATESVEEWGTTAVMARLGHESNQPRRLQIPAIGVDSFIFQDYGEDWLKLGVVQIGQPVSPGQPGNVVLAAHNDIYGEIFRHLDRLQPGHEIFVLVDQSSYLYRVRETLIVEPDDVWVTLPTKTPTITLVSCYPYLIGTQRIVVFGDLVQ